MAAVSNSTRLFTRIASTVAHAAGRPVTFVLCCAVIIVWAVSGPIFGFSDTWQLVINTGTTIVTFLMVFLIQNTQNRDGTALQTKLDELILASAAHNAFIGIEHLTDEEVTEIQEECERRAREEGEALSPRERARIAAEVAQRRQSERAEKRLKPVA